MTGLKNLSIDLKILVDRLAKKAGLPWDHGASQRLVRFSNRTKCSLRGRRDWERRSGEEGWVYLSGLMAWNELAKHHKNEGSLND